VRVRILLVLALAAGAAALPAPASANAQQAGVQIALRALGLYCGPIDGDVGPNTVAAIRAAQKQFHLPVTGLADVHTRLALGPLGRPLFGERTLRPGEFGLDVSVLQFLLLERGYYRGALDGFLGRRTETAVRRFQRGAHLEPDGIVGARTVASLVRKTGVPVRPKEVKLAAVPVAATTYVVRPGDTLTALSQRFGLSLTVIAKKNGIDPAGLLFAGKRLTIPVATPAASMATSADIRARLDAWAAREGVSQPLVRALAWMESGYQPRIVSSAGALGVLQTLPSTRQFVEEVLVGHPIARTVDGDIEVGVLFLRHLLGKFGGDERLALAAWYQGPEHVPAAILPETNTFVANVLALKGRV
jgi:LysM repeat protein